MINFMTRYLQRRGYLVLPNRVPMLVVSGNAVASSINKLDWAINFPVSPYLVALNGSMVNCFTKEDQ